MTTNRSAAEERRDRVAEVRVGARDLELWRGERCLFDQFSFTGDKPVLHVRGDNGSGKTTLLKVLCGLTAIEHGKVEWRVDGQLRTVSQMQGLLAYCGHQEGLNPALTAGENLLWGAGLYARLDYTDVQSLAARYELAHLLQVSAGGLSAGQRRRMSLIRAVLSRAPVWVWDEPYANLDSAGVDWVNRLIAEHTEQGGCLVLSAHQSPQLDSSAVQILELST